MNEWGYGAEFTYHGVLNRDQKIAYLQTLDLLSVPVTYDEPKGLFLLEAMACGVPVVQPRRGAFTEIIERTNGGILVDPENPENLADGISSLAKNPDFVAELGRNGYDGVRSAFTVSLMTKRTIDVYSNMLDRKLKMETASC